TRNLALNSHVTEAGITATACGIGHACAIPHGNLDLGRLCRLRLRIGGEWSAIPHGNLDLGRPVSLRTKGLCTHRPGILGAENPASSQPSATGTGIAITRTSRMTE